MCLLINILQIYKKYLKNENFLSQKIVAQKCGFREPLIFLLNMLYISYLTIKNEPLKSVFLSHVLVAQKCGFREPPKINSSPFIPMAQGTHLLYPMCLETIPVPMLSVQCIIIPHCIIQWCDSEWYRCKANV